jgi:PKHD-type hydroxylase
MLLEVRGVLGAGQIARLRALAAQAQWVDGKVTAGARIQEIKRNQQIVGDDPCLAEVQASVLNTLRQNEQFRLATYPKQLHGLMVARYAPGMAYGLHVDDALLGTDRIARSDLSMTLFLSGPDEYDGGELEIHGSSGVARVKLGAGDVILYHTGDLHQVLPLQRGERLVVVAWIESFVRDAEIRRLLWDLAQAREAVFLREGKSATFDLINKSHINLLRRFAET